MKTMFQKWKENSYTDISEKKGLDVDVLMSIWLHKEKLNQVVLNSITEHVYNKKLKKA